MSNLGCSPDIDWNSTGVNGVLNKPTKLSSFTNDLGLAPLAYTGAYSELVGAPVLAPVAITGSYASLTGTPALAPVATQGTYQSLTGTPSLAAVATSGRYTDLNSIPPIPTTTGVLNQGASGSGTLIAADALTGQVLQTNVGIYAANSGLESTGRAYEVPHGLPALVGGQTYVGFAQVNCCPSGRDHGIHTSVDFIDSQKMQVWCQQQGLVSSSGSLYGTTHGGNDITIMWQCSLLQIPYQTSYITNGTVSAFGNS